MIAEKLLLDYINNSQVFNVDKCASDINYLYNSLKVTYECRP